jgi:hypothetical protein
MTTAEHYIIRRPLTGELDDPDSPVRRFLQERFSAGLRDVQRRYREAAPPLAIPALPRGEVNPGTLGSAADWLLRFLVHPRPSLDLAATGAMFCNSLAALEDLACMLGMTRDDLRRGRWAFEGPAAGADAEPAHLARACWVLALLTEVYRGGPMMAKAGPLAAFTGPLAPPPSVADLLSLASPAAVSQLAAFREVFQAALLPALARRRGMWAIGPTFTGSQIMNADADLIAAGLLLDLKTSAKKPSLGVADLFQLIGYALLDYDDEFSIGSVGIFSARYAYLATWELGALLDELAGHEASLAGVRARFRELLTRHAAPGRTAR